MTSGRAIRRRAVPRATDDRSGVAYDDRLSLDAEALSGRRSQTSLVRVRLWATGLEVSAEDGRAIEVTEARADGRASEVELVADHAKVANDDYWGATDSLERRYAMSPVAGATAPGATLDLDGFARVPTFAPR
jgi:hypothetical protein